MSNIPDPILQGLQRGWKVLGGKHGALPERVSCDVAIIGSGAGAGITAELLTKAGLNVVIVEEGPLKSSTDFKQLEPEAYASLYQENAGRKTKDKGITILQGRSVGGTTTVNWTSSFRTPEPTLRYWEQHFGLDDFGREALAPYFEQAERRLNISPWLMPPNENNELLRRGADKLGIPSATISRNVKGCWNLGSCGLGCPTNAKQSMLVTSIPAALNAGARLFYQTRAHKLDIQNGQVKGLLCVPIRLNGDKVSDQTMRVVAKHYVVAGGAINSPALLSPTLQLKNHENIFFAGQITGVEGYMESAAMGLLAGLNAAFIIEGKKAEPPPVNTALGALIQYITSPEHAVQFQPMNINFGLFNAPVEKKLRKKERNALIVHQALQSLNAWISSQKLNELRPDIFC